MARHTEVRYINFYTDGSAARKIDVYTPAARPKLPKVKKKKKIVLHVDPVALLGIITSVVMLVIMTVSMFMLRDARLDAKLAQQQVVELKTENRSLYAQYRAGFELDEVEKTAEALGMVPRDQVSHVTLHVQSAVDEKPVGPLAQILAFLAGMFA